MVAIFHLDSAGVVDLKEQVNAYVKNIYDCNNIHGRFINHEGYEITNPESELDKFSAPDASDDLDFDSAELDNL